MVLACFTSLFLTLSTTCWKDFLTNCFRCSFDLFLKCYYWFPLKLHFSDGSDVNVTSEQKLLGVIIADNLKWDKNTEYICSKARQKLWVLRRLDQHNFSQYQLFDVYQKEIRSILEMCAPVWHSSLTKSQSRKIESIQKLAFKIILKSKYQNYSNACMLLCTDTLKERRSIICQKFAQKNLKSSHSFFQEVDPDAPHTRNRKKVVEYKCNTNRFYRSSLPYLSRLINSSSD